MVLDLDLKSHFISMQISVPYIYLFHDKSFTRSSLLSVYRYCVSIFNQRRVMSGSLRLLLGAISHVLFEK